MYKKSFIGFLSLFLFVSNGYSQDSTDTSPGIYTSESTVVKHAPSLAIGVGLLSYNGEIEAPPYGKRRSGFNLIVQQRIGKHFAFSASGLYGKLSDEDLDKNGHRNFESKVKQADIKLLFYFNDVNAKFSPYIYAGGGFLFFDTYADLKSEGNITYNYWDNGSIRDLPENSVNSSSSKRLKRDYTYETSLVKDKSLSVPIGLGLNMKLGSKIDLKLSGTWYLTFTDTLDNVIRANHEKSDRFIFINVAMQYTFGKKTDINAESNYTTESFDELDNLDTDEDGIKDINDNCPGTPAAVKIDDTGCPIDTDNDNVPDYLDAEPDTKPEAVVNAKGVTQTEAMIAERHAIFNEGASKRLQDIVNNRDFGKGNEGGTLNKVVIPDYLKPTDYNSDGIISTDEIGRAIADFFEGNLDLTIDKLNELIDLFFEQ